MAITMSVTTLRAYLVRTGVCFSVSCTAVIVMTRHALADSNAEAGRVAPAALQRMKVFDDAAYGFDFVVPRGPGFPAFHEVRAVARDGPERHSTQYYLFGAMEGANTLRFPLRWDIAGNTLFCTFKMLEIHQPTGPSLFRYPLDALIAGPDDGRTALDSKRAPSAAYVGCQPIGGALQGFHRGWREGVFRVGEPARVVHYDIRAIDEAQVELFVTADGELSKWLFDGKAWKNLRHYDLRVTGEFLVFDDGQSLVTEQDGQWAVIPDIEDAKAAFVAIAARVENEPLTLVEDKVERSHFFLHRDKLVDARGRELFSVRDARDHNERIRRVVDFVVARRRAAP